MLKRFSMNGKVTLKAVAEAAGAGLTTASLVLNGKASKYRIGTSTQERVRAAARQLGYKPNTVAQRMALGLDVGPTPEVPATPAMAPAIQPQVRQIGLVLSASTKTDTLALIPSLEPTLAEAGYQLVVVTFPADPAAARERVTRLLTSGVTGLLACPTTYTAVSELVAGKCPVIVMYPNAAKAVIQAIERPDSAPPAPVTGNEPSIAPPPVAEPTVVTPPVVPRPSPVAAPVPPPVAKPVAEPPVAPVPPPAPAQPAERPTATRQPAAPSQPTPAVVAAASGELVEPILSGTMIEPESGNPSPQSSPSRGEEEEQAPASPTTEQPDNSTTTSPPASEPEPVVPIEPVPAEVADDDSTVTELAQEPVPEIPPVPETEPASTEVTEAAPVATPPGEPAIVEQPDPTPTPAVVDEEAPTPAPASAVEKLQEPAPTPVVEEPQVTPPAPVQPAPEPLPAPIPVLVEDPVGTPEQVAVEASEPGLPEEEPGAETPEQADEAKPSGA